MIIFYNFFTSIAPAFLKIASIFSPKIKTWLLAVKDWKRDINNSGISSHPCNVWFHCASLGEFEQGKPVMEALKVEYPSITIIVTFFSPSGYNARKNTPIASYVGYLPMDTETNALDFLDIVKPKLAFFIKSEIWPNFISSLKKRHVPCFLLSARFREDQAIFKNRGKLFKAQLRKFDLIFVQNKASQALLKKYKIDSIFSGDTRFDQVSELLQQKKEYPLIEKFKNSKPLFIAGSCWLEDIEALQEFFKQTENKIILAPHDVSENMVSELMKLVNLPTIRYSKMNMETKLSDYKVLIIDNIGLLASLYAYSTVAYIGGGFKQGLHNILEPAVYGIPVVFGPEYEKFPEAIDMIKSGGAFSLKTSQEMNVVIQKLFANEQLRISAGAANQTFTEKSKGATEVVLRNVKTVATNLSDFAIVRS